MNVSADTVIMPQTGSTVTVVTHQPRIAGMFWDMHSGIYMIVVYNVLCVCRPLYWYTDGTGGREAKPTKCPVTTKWVLMTILIM